MNHDLTSRADIDALMVHFYSRAMSDPAIGRFFTEVVKLDLDHHLPVIGDFWESVLFSTGVYARHGRHPLMVHGEMSRKRQLEPQHFQRWLELFEESIDELFDGRAATYMKQRAHAIAGRMLQFVTTETSRPSDRDTAEAQRTQRLHRGSLPSPFSLRLCG